MENSITINGVSKAYLVGHNSTNAEQYRSLRDEISRGAKNFIRKTKDMLYGRQIIQGDQVEEFWALKNISFEIKPGERVGIIGRNGAGKSTLLKILSRITEPTLGLIKINGRVASLLEVGTGFHPELTGRENIFLNGAILGMSRKEIAKKFNEIVQFAEVEKFLDTPVKRYSSGMYVRLAFSVAAHLEPEILIVDEVLAVGDAHFQKKCLGKMQDISSNKGRTVLFVSHNMGAIRGLCEKCVWIDSGMVKEIGPAAKVIANYLEDGNSSIVSNSDSLSVGEFLVLRRVLIRNSAGDEVKTINALESFVVEMHYFSKKRILKPYFWLDIIGQYGHLFTASMMFDGLRPNFIDGEGVIRCRFDNVALLPQTYNITIRVRGENGVDVLIPTVQDAVFFHVGGSASDYQMTGDLADNFLDHDTPMLVPYQWEFDDQTIHKQIWYK